MESTMDRTLHHKCVQRAIALGRGSDPGSLAELVSLHFSEKSRLAEVLIDKLSRYIHVAGGKT